MTRRRRGRRQREQQRVLPRDDLRRRPSFTGALTGANVPAAARDLAWQAADPAVAITNVDFANDGRFIIAKKITTLGGGNYHYEFAIYNLNSDRSGGGFTVDFPAGTTISNAGFKSIPYHSGEPYSSTPWTITINGNSDQLGDGSSRR